MIVNENYLAPSRGSYMLRNYIHILFFLSILFFGIMPHAAGEWIYYDTQNSGLGDDNILCIGVDGNGAKWFGSYPGTGLGGSLAKYEGGVSWTVFNQTNSDIANNIITAIAFDPAGNIWLGTQVAGIFKYDGDTTWTSYKQGPDSGLASVNITSLAMDQSGNLWIGTAGSGVSRYDLVSSWKIYQVGDGLVNNRILSIFSDLAGNVWFGTYGGISKLDSDSQWTNYTVANSGLISDSVRCFAMDGSGNLWIGTGNGVSRFDGVSTWTNYDTSDGLAANRVNAVAVDTAGDIWFGHAMSSRPGVPVSRLDTQSHWTTYNIDHNLSSCDVTSMALDSAGDLWFGTFGQGATQYTAEPTGIYEPIDSPLPRDFSLAQNHPNPFNSSTSISYSISARAQVAIFIYDILGRKVATLVDRTLPAGKYSSIWDGRDSRGREISSGIYFYQLKSGAFSQSRKMILLK